MRLITFLLFFVIALCTINLALMNSGALSVSFWPFEQSLTLPVYLWLFIALLTGFFLGWLAHLISAFKHSKAIHKQKQQIDKQHKEAKALKDEALHIMTQRPSNNNNDESTDIKALP